MASEYQVQTLITKKAFHFWKAFLIQQIKNYFLVHAVFF